MSLLQQARDLDPYVVALIALPGNTPGKAYSVYKSFSKEQKECALRQSKDILQKAIELQDRIRANIYLYDLEESDFKFSLRYLDIEDDEVIEDYELCIILGNAILQQDMLQQAKFI